MMTVRYTLAELQAEISRLQIALLSPENLNRLNQEKLAKVIDAVKDLQISTVDATHVTIHDGEIHDPLGAGSYMFQNSLIPAVIRSAGLPATDHNGPLPPQRLTVHIGAQPNNSPHAGTLVTFFMGFVVARAIKTYYRNLSRDRMSSEFHDWIDNFEVKVQLNLVDTAPDRDSSQPNGVDTLYQRSLRCTQGFRHYEQDYDEVMRLAAEGVGAIEYNISHQFDLTKMKCFPTVIEQVIQHREKLGRLLAPDTGVLAMRAACPHEGCGLADKHGAHNKYTTHAGGITVSFFCPLHGWHTVSTSKPEEVARLEFNTPLRNLVRSIAYAIDTAESQKEVAEGKERCRRTHIRLTGSDYAGFYCDEMFWRAWLMLGLEKDLTPPVVLYAPLIVDWAGSKLSKSHYVKDGAYKYMKETGIDYLLSFDGMKRRGKDPLVLLRMVESWVKEPKKLFRSFSADYLHMKFCEAEGQQM